MIRFNYIIQRCYLHQWKRSWTKHENVRITSSVFSCCPSPRLLFHFHQPCLSTDNIHTVTKYITTTNAVSSIVLHGLWRQCKNRTIFEISLSTITYQRCWPPSLVRLQHAYSFGVLSLVQFVHSRYLFDLFKYTTVSLSVSAFCKMIGDCTGNGNTRIWTYLKIDKKTNQTLIRLISGMHMPARRFVNDIMSAKK